MAKTTRLKRSHRTFRATRVGRQARRRFAFIRPARGRHELS